MNNAARQHCPLTVNLLMNAVLDGKFVPLTEIDRMGFAGCPDKALIWHVNDKVQAIMYQNEEESGVGFQVFQEIEITEGDNDILTWDITSFTAIFHRS